MTHVPWRMKGEIFDSCSCSVLCPCETVGWPGPSTFCEGVFGMHIIEGHFGEVSLDGLKFAVVYHFPGAVHEGNGEIQPYLDVKATEVQRSALMQILTGKAGGDFGRSGRR